MEHFTSMNFCFSSENLKKEGTRISEILEICHICYGKCCDPE